MMSITIKTMKQTNLSSDMMTGSVRLGSFSRNCKDGGLAITPASSFRVTYS